MTEADLKRIQTISEESITKFWFGIETLKKRKVERISEVVKAEEKEEDITDDEIQNLNQLVAASITTTALAIETILALNQVTPPDQGAVYIFRPEGDDRVCPICEPLAGEIMKESDGTVVFPPFHDNCRCMLEPVT